MTEQSKIQNRKSKMGMRADRVRAVPGVGKVDFSLERSVAVLEFDPALAHIDDFLRAVLKAGFQVL